MMWKYKKKITGRWVSLLRPFIYVPFLKIEHEYAGPNFEATSISRKMGIWRGASVTEMSNLHGRIHFFVHA